MYKLQVQRIPIIRLEDILLVSIQVALHDKLVIQLQDDIANTIRKDTAKGVVIDVSGVEIMDSFIARSINDIAKQAKLMGTETVIVGIRPEIAITLVEMGLEMDAANTALNLDSAMKMINEITQQITHMEATDTD